MKAWLSHPLTETPTNDIILKWAVKPAYLLQPTVPYSRSAHHLCVLSRMGNFCCSSTPLSVMESKYKIEGVQISSTENKIDYLFYLFLSPFEQSPLACMSLPLSSVWDYSLPFLRRCSVMLREEAKWRKEKIAYLARNKPMTPLLLSVPFYRAPLPGPVPTIASFWVPMSSPCWVSVQLHPQIWLAGAPHGQWALSTLWLTWTSQWTRPSWWILMRLRDKQRSGLWLWRWMHLIKYSWMKERKNLMIFSDPWLWFYMVPMLASFFFCY